MRIHGLLLPVKVQPIPKRSTKIVLPILDHPYQRRKRVSMMKSRKTLIRRLEKPRDFDPFGQAGFAHLWLQYD